MSMLPHQVGSVGLNEGNRVKDLRILLATFENFVLTIRP